MRISRPPVVFVALVCLPLLLATGCAPRDRRFEEAYARVAAGREGQELLAALVALDQQYPDRLSLKVNLGALCLAAGDLQGAAAYLERGETLAAAPRHRHDKRLRYLLQANLAEHHLRAGRPEQSVTHADRALALDVEDTVGVVFTRAKAHLAVGDHGAALADFAAGRGAARGMNLEDYGGYIQALLAGGRPAEALLAYGERQQRFGYLSGQGLEESLLYERLGRLEEAVLSAFLELEHRRGQGAVSEQTVRANLRALARRLQEPGGGALRVLEGLDDYLAGDWPRAQAAFAEVRLEVPHPLLEYLVLAARLEQGASPAELTRYVQLEPPLRSLAAYYHHLWRGLRASGGSYNFAAARPVLEKAILVGPDGRFAEEARAEIGRLLGLEPSQGRYLLLGQEVKALARRAAAERRPETLEPVLAFLGLPDTPYTTEALLVLQQALAVPALRQYLEQRRAAAGGRLRERLIGLLGG